MTPINLDLKTGLPLLRQAWLAGRVAAQDRHRPGIDGACRYRYPNAPTIGCGIGVMILDQDYDPVLDPQNSMESGSFTIDSHITDHRILVPKDQRKDFEAVQAHHDSLLTGDIQVEKFVDAINLLCVKYGVEQLP